MTKILSKECPDAVELSLASSHIQPIPHNGQMYDKGSYLSIADSSLQRTMNINPTDVHYYEGSIAYLSPNGISS